MLAVRRECDRVDRFLVAGERVKRDSPLNIPQPHGGVERRRGQDKVGVGIRRSRAGAGPLDGVDLFVVSLEVVKTGVPVHAPDFEGHIVGAAGQELALRVPLDRINLKSKSKKLFNSETSTTICSNQH